jgi:DnaA-homolog protein
MKEAKQLPLGLRLDNEATFDNYYIDSDNSLLVNQLQLQARGEGEQWIYLWGQGGRSHLLQASCHLAEQSGRAVRYIPLSELAEYPAEALLDGAEMLDLLCLDDVDTVISAPDWEVALFNLYNAAMASGTAVLISSAAPVSSLAINLADLQSRLQSFCVYRLAGLDDDGLKAVLRFRAERRGLVIGDQVSEYLFTRCNRELKSLIQVLEHLDHLSLEQKRRITIPFIKAAMGW